MRSLLSIALQVLIAVSLTVVIVLGISSVIELRILKHRERQQMAQQGAVKAERIANSLANPLSSLNQAETDRVVRDELAAEEATRIQVLNERGQLYVGKVKTADGSMVDLNQENLSDQVPGGIDYSVQRDINFKGNRIGFLKLDVSSAYLRQELNTLGWGIAIKLLMLLIILSVVLYVALRVLVVRRLSLLKAWVEDPQSKAAPPHFRFSDEINSLSEAFGKMSVNLRQQHETLAREHAQLVESNTQLGEKIEQRKLAESALRESENRFRQLTENIDEVLWLQAPDYSTILYISPTYEKVWGRTTASLYENPYSFLEAIHPDDRSWVEQRIRNERTQGFSLEYRIVQPDGAVRWIWDRGFPIKDDSGVVHRIAGIAEDITERKQAQEELRRYTDEVRDLYNNAPCGYHSLDENGFYVQINDTELEWIGYTREEVLGKLRFSDILPPGSQPAFEENYREFIASGSVKDVEYQICSKDGVVRNVLLSATASKNSEGKFLMSRATVYDITDRRYIQQELKANEELLRLFVKHTPAAIAMFDTDMRYLQVSDRFLTDYHLGGQDIIGKRHYDVFSNIPERWKEVHRRILAGSVERMDEEPYEDADGSQGWLQWESLPWRKADGEIGGLILFTQVITERKRAEEALRSSEERFARIFNLSPYRMGIVRVSDGRILDVNDCWVRETGYSKEESVNHIIYEMDHWLGEEMRTRISNSIRERRPVISFEGMMKTKMGEERYTISSAALVEFDGEPCYLWASNDISERKQAEEEKRFLIHDLGERVKELTALHQTARILQDESKSIPDLLQEIVSLLPQSWQYPEVTAARIRFGDVEYKTKGFVQSQWSQGVEFSAGNVKGEIEVIYSEERPTADIGPFVLEEANLIKSLAEMISSTLNRRYAQKALQESEEVFRTLAETVSAGTYIYRDSRFIYVNPTAEKLTGYSREELLTMSPMDLMHPDFRDSVGEQVKQRERGWHSPSRHEDKILKKDGEERWMDVSAAGTQFRGQPAVIVTAFDITARKHAEEELQRSEARYRTLFETAPDAVGVYDSEMRLLMANERGASLWGFKNGDEQIGRSAYDFIAPEDRDRLKALIEEIQRTGKLAVFESTGLRSDQTRFDLETRATLIPNTDGQPPSVLTVNTDITNRKIAEKALKASEEQLRALSAKAQSAREEEGTRIAREIHDELGGALTGLKWDLEGIETSLMTANGSPTISDVRKRIISMTGLIESTINTVRRISSELRPGVLDDLGLVAAIEWQAQQFQRRTGLKLHWETDLDNTEVSRDGATAVFRIFQEVLTNILRHSRAKNIYVKLFEIDHSLELEVTDDGRGITDEEQQNTRSLGLLGMKERALLVEGEVSIKGVQGKGTRVLVRIPLSQDIESETVA
jgi:PAS domain S-box-containing protein